MESFDKYRCGRNDCGDTFKVSTACISSGPCLDVSEEHAHICLPQDSDRYRKSSDPSSCLAFPRKEI